MLKSSYSNHFIEAGCDEAGRGCLAGPVVAAAVILPLDYKNELLNDSKKLNEKSRNRLKLEIQNNAIAWAIGIVTHQEIDKINILNASILAMHRALDQLSQTPQLIIVDGNRFKPYHNIPYYCIVKGDGKYLAIAAASILAKTYRDDLMITLSKEYPQYGWERNKSYATRDHILALEEFGQSPLHRKSFHLKRQTKLDL